MATDDLGIRQIPPMAGETADDAIARTILQILRELTAGTRNAIPMGAVSVALRRDVDWDISESAIGATVERIDDLLHLAPNPCDFIKAKTVDVIGRHLCGCVLARAVFVPFVAVGQLGQTDTLPAGRQIRS